ncbi:MAG: methylmalonyl-CoA mutase, partial [Planctomycetes bacterium]|nr:methylmalonyl-CoA mutase [Planctomycetota bacterium]
ILSGAHMTLFPEILDLMKERKMGDVLLCGGGIIPPDDAQELANLGVGRLFGPGTDTRDIVKYLQDEIPRRRPR